MNRLPDNKFARGVGILVGGTAGAQILMVLAAPVLTRLYTPDDFGMLAVYVGFLSILSVISCLRYEFSIPLPKSDVNATNIIILCAFVLFVFTIIFTIILYFFASQLVEAIGVPRLEAYIWLLPIGVFVTGIYNIFNYWAIREKKYKKIACTKMAQSLSMILVQVGGVKFGVVSLLAGQAVGQGVGAIKLAQSFKNVSINKTVKLNKIYALARRYRNFPFYSTWTGFFNTAGNQLPPIIFAALFGSSVAGFYALAHRVTSLPASVIGQAVANVFLSSAPNARRNGTLHKLIVDVVGTLSSLAIPAGVFMAINAEFLFGVIFGEDWYVAGIYAAILVPMLIMGFITAPVTTLCAVLDKQSYGTIFQFIMLIVRILSIMTGVYFSDPIVALFFFSLSSAVCYLIFVLWLVYIAGGKVRSLIYGLIKKTVTACLIFLPSIVLEIIGSDSIKELYSEFLLSFFMMLIVYSVSYRSWKLDAKS